MVIQKGHSLMIFKSNHKLCYIYMCDCCVGMCTVNFLYISHLIQNCMTMAFWAKTCRRLTEDKQECLPLYIQCICWFLVCITGYESTW